MTINPTDSNYMSNASIMEWMEMKTEDLYGKMRDAMDQSNNRVTAENELNNIKAKMQELKTSGGDAGPLRKEIDEAIKKYGAEFPELGEVLQPISNELRQRAEALQPKRVEQQESPTKYATTGSRSGPAAGSGYPTATKGEKVEKTNGDSTPIKAQDPHITVSSDDAERWSKSIADTVDTLGKQDQLGMVHLQDFNSQLNRTKDTASALMASADKAADNIVAHIS